MSLSKLIANFNGTSMYFQNSLRNVHSSLAATSSYSKNFGGKMNFLRIILTVAVAIILFLFVTFLTILAILFQPYRLFVWILAKCLDSNTVGFAKGLSAFILLASAEKPWLNVLINLVIDGDVSSDKLRANFEHCILEAKEYENLRRYFTKFMGFTILKDTTDFKLSNHIRPYDYKGEASLPCPFNEDDLRRASAGVIAANWKRGQSPWEIVVARNFHYQRNDTPKTVLLFKFDHGLMDGFSMLKILYKLFDGEDTLPTGSSPRRSCWELAFFPFKLFYDIADQYIDAFTWQNTWVLGENRQLQFYSAMTPSIPMGEIKKIKNKYNVSYSAVLMAGVSGGMYRIMKEVGQDIPKYMTCVIPLPRNNHPGGLTNHMNCSRFALRISPSNPDVMQKLSHDMKKTTTSLAILGLRYFTYLGSLMPNFVSHILLYPDSGQTAVGIANVPISNGHYTFDGFPVIDLVSFLANDSGVFPPGFSLAMGGFDKKQRISATIDKSLFPSEEVFKKLGKYIQEEILNMLHE